jgi:hypothetical protein
MAGLSRLFNILPSLSERREKQTLREIEAIIRDADQPCHRLVPVAHKHDYSTRIQENSANVGNISSTERHKSSFMPRAISLSHATIFGCLSSRSLRV